MSIDDSACNLASLNLMKFRRDDGELDVEAFEHAVDVVFLAQEIAVGYSSYPTPEIGRNARAFRQLGLGYANLGALLMTTLWYRAAAAHETVLLQIDARSAHSCCKSLFRALSAVAGALSP